MNTLTTTWKMMSIGKTQMMKRLWLQKGVSGLGKGGTGRFRMESTYLVGVTVHKQ